MHLVHVMIVVELIEQVDLPEFEPEPELVVKPMKKG